MRRFVIKILLFFLPWIVLGVLPCYILFSTKENFHRLNKTITENKTYIIGYAYNESNYRYLKWAHLNYHPRYDVLALGSSRVLQFRDFMFRGRFYNAGYTITSINDFKPFLESIPESNLPKTILISIDQWMFNENWDQLKSFKDKSFWRKAYSFTPTFSTIQSVYGDVIRGKYFLPEGPDSAGIAWIGLNAIINQKGFRNDGSIAYGSEILGPNFKPVFKPDSVFDDTFKRIERGRNRFEFGKKPNPLAYQRLELALRYCREKNISVVGFLPPFAPMVNDKLQASEKHAYMFDIFPRLQSLFEEYGYNVYDFTSAQEFGSFDEEFIDGFHGGEVTYTRILLEMAKSDTSFASVIDSPRLLEAVNKNNKRRKISGLD